MIDFAPKSMSPIFNDCNYNCISFTTSDPLYPTLFFLFSFLLVHGSFTTFSFYERASVRSFVHLLFSSIDFTYYFFHLMTIDDSNYFSIITTTQTQCISSIANGNSHGVKYTLSIDVCICTFILRMKL